jgi:hypothetical protein
MKVSADVMACQSRARDYDREEHLNSAFRRVPEVPNFGRDQQGLQITTLQDALGECERRYLFPTTTSHFWRSLFRDMRHQGITRDTVPPIADRLFSVGMFLVIPVLFYTLLNGLVWLSMLSIRWIQRGFRSSPAVASK